MDQQVINKHVAQAVTIMRETIELAYKERRPFSSAALLLGTVEVNGAPLDQPVLISLTPECITPALTLMQFNQLLLEAAGESKAVAIVIGFYATPIICVETRTGWTESRGKLTTTGWKWGEPLRVGPLSGPSILPCYN